MLIGDMQLKTSSTGCGYPPPDAIRKKPRRALGIWGITQTVDTYLKPDGCTYYMSFSDAKVFRRQRQIKFSDAQVCARDLHSVRAGKQSTLRAHAYI